MAWKDVDLQKNIWTIPASITKNKNSHRVPLSKQVVEIIKSRKNQAGSSWIFPSSHGSGRGYVYNVQKAAKKIREEAGVKDFRLHDMRRTAASMMAAMGVFEFNIGKVLNHTNESITSVYNRHSYDSEKRIALEKWAGRIEQILSGKKAKVVNLR